ncbi:hypothetical protein FC83_GL000690 [Agrilactobacillus composti DSM 18527 = JCM 14202]|uniref:DUF3784 domain-containing protein n=1 Tax=Agrilactobacillus composti DSM 18527 = JCM 14202 TaxID=1423734 RepID=X0PP06_9LACO|nr:DUF3784 domain-containing protein [Agrilactobacillus composti]KRM31624.1 hypothetical protein FC83_GL000690 [Agrilactobacillus composti DSM 18527 = JCM 14202]GAF39342.1 hypothetical protein JCM14202_1199 [Agrilactobacillus composti DSM 18527 = JCM 14202]
MENIPILGILAAVVFVAIAMFGLLVRNGKGLDLLAGYAPEKYSEPQKRVLGRLSGNYIIFLDVSLLPVFWILTNNKSWAAVGAVLLIIGMPLIIFVIYMNRKVDRIK